MCLFWLFKYISAKLANTELGCLAGDTCQVSYFVLRECTDYLYEKAIKLYISTDGNELLEDSDLSGFSLQLFKSQSFPQKRNNSGFQFLCVSIHLHEL